MITGNIVAYGTIQGQKTSHGRRKSLAKVGQIKDSVEEGIGKSNVTTN
jgi:hypothetical protein